MIIEQKDSKMAIVESVTKGECFMRNKHLFIRTSESLTANNKIRAVELGTGNEYLFDPHWVVKQVRAKVVVEDDS